MVRRFRVSAEAGPLIVVRAPPSQNARARRTSWVGKQEEYQLLPNVVVRGRSLAVDPALLYHALRYYFGHPEAGRS
jgi:hypothetical protein